MQSACWSHIGVCMYARSRRCCLCRYFGKILEIRDEQAKIRFEGWVMLLYLSSVRLSAVSIGIFLHPHTPSPILSHRSHTAHRLTLFLILSLTVFIYHHHHHHLRSYGQFFDLWIGLHSPALQPFNTQVGGMSERPNCRRMRCRDGKTGGRMCALYIPLTHTLHTLGGQEAAVCA